MLLSSDMESLKIFTLQITTLITFWYGRTESQDRSRQVYTWRNSACLQCEVQTKHVFTCGHGSLLTPAFSDIISHCIENVLLAFIHCWKSSCCSSAVVCVFLRNKSFFFLKRLHFQTIFFTIQWPCLLLSGQNLVCPYFFFFLHKSLLSVTLYECLWILQIFDQWQVLKKPCDQTS